MTLSLIAELRKLQDIIDGQADRILDLEEARKQTTLVDKYSAEQNLRKKLHAWKFWRELGPALRADLVAAIDWTYRELRQPVRKEHPLWRIDLICEQADLYTKQEIVDSIRKICAEGRS